MHQRRIYIAEEDKAIQHRLNAALTRKGFDVTLFDSGYPIVSMMDNWPDVFLIDIELPGINGLEVCKWLKSRDDSSHIPVIFLSGDPYLKVLAAAAHADDYVELPVSIADIVNRINDCLSAENGRLESLSAY